MGRTIIVRLDVETLAKCSDTFLFDYLKENGVYLTKPEMYDLVFERHLNIHFAVNEDKPKMVNKILDKIGTAIIAEIINSNLEQRWQLMRVLMKRDEEYKINFVKENGKFLNKYELTTLLREDCEIEAKTYEEMLIDTYLDYKLQKVLA